MKAMREAWGEHLVDIAARDPRTVVLDGDLGTSTKADIFAAERPDRFLQMGIAEQNMIGVAAGLASMGQVPWISTFTVFLTHRALDPIRMLVAQSEANVKLAGAYSGLLIGAVGKTHLDVQDISIMRAMPGMTVLAPADEYELMSMMDWAQDYHGPVYMRLTRDPGPALFDARYTFDPGAVLPLRAGNAATLVSTGAQSCRVLDAASILSKEGVEVSVVHVPSIKPVDEGALLETLAEADLVVSVEDHSVMGGLGGLVAEVLSTRAQTPRLVRIGLDDVWGESASNDFLLDKHELSAPLIAKRVIRELT